MSKETSPDKKKQDKKRSIYLTVENIQVLILAIVLSFVIRIFIIEPFQIPTGSMATTLMGNHLDFTCNNCGFHFPVGINLTPGGGFNRVICPNCGYPNEYKPPANSVLHNFLERLGFGMLVYGDRIFVNKFYFNFTKPKRWEIMVFHPPYDVQKNYIKRIVGLPNEILQIIDGDIYIDGVLQRKPQVNNLQEQLWTPFYDSTFRQKQHQRFWYFDNPYVWKEDDNLVRVRPQDDSPTFATNEYNITDFMGYNAGGKNYKEGKNIVGDIKYKVTITPVQGSGYISLSIFENYDRYQLLLPVNGASQIPSLIHSKGKSYYFPDSYTEVNKFPLVDVPTLSVDKEYDVEFSNVDDIVTVKFNGNVVLTYIYDREESISPFFISDLSRIRMAVSGCAVDFKNMKIFTDEYYVNAFSPAIIYDADENTVKVPANSYFMLGDNSEVSLDSRKWGFVPEENIVGRAFVVWWPLQRWKVIQ